MYRTSPLSHHPHHAVSSSTPTVLPISSPLAHDSTAEWALRSIVDIHKSKLHCPLKLYPLALCSSPSNLLCISHVQWADNAI